MAHGLSVAAREGDRLAERQRRQTPPTGRSWRTALAHKELELGGGEALSLLVGDEAPAQPLIHIRSRGLQEGGG